MEVQWLGVQRLGVLKFAEIRLGHLVDLHFCPSCHARRLAAWSLWLEEQLPAHVPHRQVVFTVPKRLR